MTNQVLATVTPPHLPLPEVPVDRVLPPDLRVPAPDVPVDIVDQWGEQSFPASDPPANW
ncbi:hypothetical protein V1634_19850 [Plantactinospora veratri]|uniref:Uncharacterized protein n=1 Tax=Plantactinospora veratri TaxID=1436122 RepID=A0ABU7SGM9_9ACTN